MVATVEHAASVVGGSLIRLVMEVLPALVVVSRAGLEARWVFMVALVLVWVPVVVSAVRVLGVVGFVLRASLLQGLWLVVVLQAVSV